MTSEEIELQWRANTPQLLKEFLNNNETIKKGKKLKTT